MRLPVTVALVFSLFLLWLVGAVLTPENETGALAMSVGDTIVQHIRPWVFFSAGFYHPYLLQLVFVVPITFSLAKRVEDQLGAMNLLRMLLFVNVLTTFFLFFDMFCLYIVVRNPAYLKTNLSGFSGGLTALIVALIKSNPQATSALLPTIKQRYYPLLACLVFWCITGIALMAPQPSIRAAFLGAGPFAFFGAYLGWYYLRFLQRNSDGTKGNVSPDFALVMLLPDFCTPIIRPLCNFCYEVVRLCGYFKSRPSNNTTLPVVMPSARTDDPVAERRKARAMKALDEKLAKLATAKDSTLPLVTSSKNSIEPSAEV